MILNRLNLKAKDQHGFSMLELIMAFAVAAILVTGIITAIFQMVNVNARSSNHMTTIREAQSAGYWISHDAQMTQQEPVIVEDAGVFQSVTFSWVEWDNTSHQVVFTLDNGDLKRSHSIDGGVPSMSIVARSIDPDPALTHVDYTAGVLTLQVTVSVGTGSQTITETRIYRAIPRPSL